MKLLAISDEFIPREFMEKGLNGLQKYGIEIDIRQWKHDNLEMLQKDNLIIEKNGPDFVELSEKLMNNIEEYDILIVQFAPVSKKLIDRAKNLKIIGVLRGGIENVDYKYAASKDIAVINTPGRNSRAVAEFTIGMILSEIRNISRSYAALKTGNWRKKFPNSGSIPELYNKIVGLVGFGHVGKLVADYLKVFGCRVISYDPFFEGSSEKVRFVDLKYLLKHSDIVSIHARLTDNTYHMIGEKEIEMMKSTAILVNTARSGLVDQQSLVKALYERKIAGAAIDVFDIEPIPDNDKILKLDNITITSHMAGSTKDAFVNSPVLMKDILIKVLNKDENLNY